MKRILRTFTFHIYLSYVSDTDKHNSEFVQTHKSESLLLRPRVWKGYSDYVTLFKVSEATYFQHCIWLTENPRRKKDILQFSGCFHQSQLQSSGFYYLIRHKGSHKKKNYQILDIVQTWRGVSGAAKLFIEKRYGHVLRGEGGQRAMSKVVFL